jgi:hypothetical protein
VIRVIEHEQVGLPGHTLSYTLEGHALTIRYDGQEHVVDLSEVPPEGLSLGNPTLPAAAFLGAEWDGEDVVVHVVVWKEDGAAPPMEEMVMEEGGGDA